MVLPGLLDKLCILPVSLIESCVVDFFLVFVCAIRGLPAHKAAQTKASTNTLFPIVFLFYCCCTFTIDTLCQRKHGYSSQGIAQIQADIIFAEQDEGHPHPK